MPDLARLRRPVPVEAAALLAGRDPAPPGAGPLVRWDAHAGPAGATVLVPHSDRALLRTLQAARPRPPRKALHRAVRALVPPARLEVPGGGVPAVVTAACPGHGGLRAALVLGGGGPRRRAVFLVAEPAADLPQLVVKASPLAHGRAAEAQHEQHVLAVVARVSPGLAPEPRGCGATDSFTWSAETASAGWPLAELAADTTRHGQHSTRRLLDQLAARLTDVAAATAAPARWTPASPAVRLRGRFVAAGRLLQGLQVPSVLVHGDLATAQNVLASPGGCHVIDWETATERGLPLLDLLPLLALVTARASGRREPADQAEYVISLCAGRTPASGWLLGLVTDHCRRVGVPLHLAGALAALAWSHVASMPDVHRELVQRTGAAGGVWHTPAQDVAERWLDHPDLGVAWPALAAAERS